MKKKIFNLAWGAITVMVNEADAAAPAELMIYDTIGADPWSNGGITAADIKNALSEITDTKRPLNIRVNSKGGDVHEGMAIMSLLNEYPGKKKTIIDGIAASTSSWAFTCPADEVVANKFSQMFVHDAMAFTFGNASDLEKTASDLDKTSDQIAAMYAEKSGGSKKSWRDMMRNSTLLTAEEAEDLGLVDSILDIRAVNQFTSKEIGQMTNRLASFYNTLATKPGKGNQQQENTMNKKELIAFLNKMGVKEWDGKVINSETSDEHLKAAMDSIKVENKQPEPEKKNKKDDDAPVSREEFIKLQNDQTKLLELNKVALKNKLTLAIDQLIVDDKLPKASRDKALARCINDESYLEELQALPARPPGANPVSNLVECTGEAFTDVQNFILDCGPRFMKNFIGGRAGDTELDKKVCKDIATKSTNAARAIKKHNKMLVEMFNTNNIDAGLQRQIIMQMMIEEFAVILLPFQNFSTVFSNVPLEGTDEVDVPYYPLATGNGNSWVAATGYAANLLDDTTTNTRPVVVGGTGVTSGTNAAINTAKDRKWIGAQFNSAELARQPYLNTAKLMAQKANRLGVLVFQDIVSRVINAANFGASAKAVPAGSFSSDDVADLYGTATGLNWPTTGRSLTIDHSYNVSLIKDPTYKYVLNAGNDDALRRAAVKNTYQFDDIPIVPNLASYSPGPATNGQATAENLVGWIAWQYAVLIATAPIMPTPEVRALMTRYDLIVHPSIGLTFEYRRFGDATLDVTKEVIEISYGAAKGVQSALKRLTSQ